MFFVLPTYFLYDESYGSSFCKLAHCRNRLLSLLDQSRSRTPLRCGSMASLLL
ncbi:MAG TPA: hypothetical protein VL485_30725 [Ktedonobacteraceae bacterium]|nr:hypothetical protein [Ktedonobacteraceae bacterium]